MVGGGDHHVVGVFLVVVVVEGPAVVVVVDVSVLVVESVDVVESVEEVGVSVELVVEGVSIVVDVSSACTGAVVTHKNRPTLSASANTSRAGVRRTDGIGTGTPLQAAAGGEGLPRRINRRLRLCSGPISANTTFPRFLSCYRQGGAWTFVRAMAAISVSGGPAAVGYVFGPRV
jgi:hypothetical protein